MGCQDLGKESMTPFFFEEAVGRPDSTKQTLSPSRFFKDSARIAIKYPAHEQT
jgi:hypothetical protein